MFPERGHPLEKRMEELAFGVQQTKQEREDAALEFQAILQGCYHRLCAVSLEQLLTLATGCSGSTGALPRPLELLEDFCVGGVPGLEQVADEVDPITFTFLPAITSQWLSVREQGMGKLLERSALI